MISRSICFLKSGLTAVLCLLPVVGVAQNYPNRAISLTVPFPPGGVGDLVARPIAEKVAAALGQPVVIENRAGASGTLAATHVARSSPDGYTLLFGTNNELAMSPSLLKSIPYDPTTAFAPITMVSQFPNVLVLGPSMKVGSLAELIEFLRKNPGKVTFATSGPGSTNHLTSEIFKSLAKVSFVDVHYKGGAPAVTDVLAGHVDAMFATLPSAVGAIKSGKLRALAVTGEGRSPALPDVPSSKEAGAPGLIVLTWQGVLAPAGTSAAIVDQLYRAIRAAAVEPDVKARLAAAGVEQVNQDPQQFAVLIRSEFARWRTVIKNAGITLQ